MKACVIVLRRLGRMVGGGVVIFLALGSSPLGWIPALTGLPLSGFLVAIGVVSLALAWRLAEEPS